MADSKKKIALLSNITVDLIAAKLRRKYDFYLPEGFDTWVQEVINPASGLYNENIDSIIVLLDGTEVRSWKSIEDGESRLDLWENALDVLVKSFKSVPIFISTIDIRENRIKSLAERTYRYYFENNWYQYIQELTENNDNVFVFDTADIIAEIGRKHFYSNKMWYMSSMPYSREGLEVVCNSIDNILESVFSPRKKIIVLDLDNTLWGGVIGEDGLEGIELSDHKEGQRFYDFQRQLLEMKNRGILLAINSKNNLDDAEEAINNHKAMLLHDDDFVCRKINWDNKSSNIKAMESELNLTEGGFIFIDDNPIEREIVGGECPEVIIPEFPEDTTELISFAENIWNKYCRPLRVLGEDLKKTEMYKNEAQRKQARSQSIDIDDYIAKLEIEVDIHRMRENELNRVVQLINKTNQFNVTTKRYTKAEVEEINNNTENRIYVVYSSDKYGDSGLISIIILKCQESEVYIDTFLMSCRVMGRKLEDVIINEILSRLSGKINAEYIPTAKNAPVSALYDKLGFTLLNESEAGTKKYEMNLNDFNKKKFDNYKSIVFED